MCVYIYFLRTVVAWNWELITRQTLWSWILLWKWIRKLFRGAPTLQGEKRAYVKRALRTLISACLAFFLVQATAQNNPSRRIMPWDNKATANGQPWGKVRFYLGFESFRKTFPPADNRLISLASLVYLFQSFLAVNADRALKNTWKT